MWERACPHYNEIRASERYHRIWRSRRSQSVFKAHGVVAVSGGVQQRDILRLIQEPADDEAVLSNQVRQSDQNPGEENIHPEPDAAATWHAVADVSRISQEAVSRRGVLLRYGSIAPRCITTCIARWIRIRPATTSPDKANPGRRFSFLVRARQEHGWHAPPFKFNCRQDRAYQCLMAAAEAIVTLGDESDPSDDSDESIDDDSDAERASFRSA